MPMTPDEALSKCPAAHLDDDEKAALGGAILHADALMLQTWAGASITLKTLPMSAKVFGRFLRAFMLKKWIPVSVKPLDGMVGSAQDVLGAGGAVEWEVGLSPDWRP